MPRRRKSLNVLHPPEHAHALREIDRAALARAHVTYRRAGLRERNDEIEMQKKVPGWKFAATRW